MIVNILQSKIFLTSVCLVLFFQALATVEAAALRVTPATGVYQAGSTFNAQVQVVTHGDPINAAEGTLSFNPDELTVLAVNRSSSIFNLWVAEPTFSNSAGTISFSGGVPSGYSGSVGNVVTVTFRANNAGSPRVSFTNGSVLANDGRGTNVLTTMNGGSFTVQAASASPEPERIIEYIPPANTPAAPSISSQTHSDPEGWHQSTEATLVWPLPADVTGVRTLLDQSPNTIPTKVYEDPIDSITLSDLPEGESYFHLQFRNADGWGKVTHYRLAVDASEPTNLTISSLENADMAAPEQELVVAVTDAVSGISSYWIKIDAAEPYEYIPETASGTIQLPALDPGYHSVIIEAFDQAGNSTIGTYSFTIEAFDQPVFTEIPTEMSGDVIPVISGFTRPFSVVSVFFARLGSEPSTYEVSADKDGLFTFIPEGKLYSGVYEVSAQAVDQYGAQSAVSEVSRIAVQDPGYIRLGNQIVSAMSIIVPLTLMTLLLFFGIWYLLFVFRRYRRAVTTESIEALDILHREFSHLQTELRQQETALQKSRKTHKLTKAEAAMIETFDRALQQSQRAVKKEIEDITKLTDKE